MAMIKRKKATDIYKKQNTLLHKAFAASGLPYGENKDVWLSLCREIAERDVTGLSDLTLSERHKLLAHFQKRGMRLFVPAVHVKVRDWKKGDREIEYEYREEDDPQVRMVYAMWNEMGYREKTLRGLCWKLFKVNDPRWLNDGQLSRLVNVVKVKAQSKGLGNYYRRTA